MVTIPMSPTQKREINFKDWFTQYGKRLSRFILSKIQDFEEAEDIAQEVWHSLAKEEEPEAIKEIENWLFRVARNRILNFYKKKKTIPFSKLEMVEPSNHYDSEPLEEELEFNDWMEDEIPSDILERKEFWEIFQILISELPKEQREIFIENEMEGRTFKEISEKSGTSMNTLLARKSYAIKKLKLRLASFFGEFLE